MYEYQLQLESLYNQIKQMKLKQCVTVNKLNNQTETTKIIKKSITKRTFGENEIVFKMDDFISWSIHDLNINEIVVTDNAIQLFENESYIVSFTK